MGLWRAILEAVLGGADDFAGQSVTELTSALTDVSVGPMAVKSTVRFGENKDGTSNARVLVNGEIIEATGRTLTSFTGLTRGVDTTPVRLHPFGSLVFDLSFNRTARDLVRRGFFVRTARLEDLDTIGRNLGLHKCPGLDEETWRSLISVMAYLPNQPIDAFKAVLDVYPGVGNYRLFEDLITAPNVVTVEIDLTAFGTTSLRGKFFLNGGEEAKCNDGLHVTTLYPINNVSGVFIKSQYTDHGERDGLVNYYLPGGTFVGSTITLGTPVAPGSEMVVDYGAFTAHYLGLNETLRAGVDGDYFPYLSDASAIITCLLDQIRAAGVKVNIVTTVF